MDDRSGSPSHPSLALGTHDAARSRDDQTRVESPGAQKKLPTGSGARGSARSKSSSRPPAKEDVTDHINTTLGSYRVLDLLGRGGMGYVFRAEHVKLGREVALKLLRSDYARRRDAVARFFQEARTVNRVRHRNIVDVTDFVELEDGTTFIIMELLRGQSLGKWARTGIDLPRALAVLVQICDGLGAAHQVGVVHRDLKPDNVIVVPTSDGAEMVKLLDFGVAKLLNRDDEDVGFQTAAGSVIGTPAYMSPEQAGGMVVDARSDIYSLGAIMYELFCGQPMFRGRSFGEYVRKHLTEMPTPPRNTAGGAQIDPRLEILIMKCLEKDPNYRFGNILELRDALLGMLGGLDTQLGSITQSGVRPPPQLLAIPSIAGGGRELPLAAPPPSVNQPPPPSGPRSSIGPGPLTQALQTILPSSPQIPTLPTPASGIHPSVYYNPYASVIAPPEVAPPPTPWWVWFVGGALAVALGVAAAIWYAGRDEHAVTLKDPVIAPAPAPVAPVDRVEPVEPPPVAEPRFVEVKFDSLPSGGVYEDGRSAELCRTPCTFNIDLADDGPDERLRRRTFVVRAEGYRDASIVVDLAAASAPAGKREFTATLERAEVDKPAVRAQPHVTTHKKPRIGRTVEPKPEKSDPKPEPKPEPVIDKPKPDPKKGKPTTIDATELKDPFKKKP